MISYSASIESIGQAVIEKGDMRTAYNSALENAIIGSVRLYYQSYGSLNENIPDVSSEYLKFVKSYDILSREITNYTVTVRILADLDTVALADAGMFISNPVNNVVFAFSGIPDKILPPEALFSSIDNALSSKKFSTKEQKNFQYTISDMEDRSQLLTQFDEAYSNYLFIFNFQLSSEEIINHVNNCELTTTTEIISKSGQRKILKIETSSSKSNLKQCVSEAMQKAITSTVDYIRKNLIQIPDQERALLSYKIKAVNFKNMVGTKDFISTLKQRGFITSYEAISFSGKEIIFKVNSYFTKQELQEKLQTVVSEDMNFKYYTDGDEIILDFTSQESNIQSQDVE